MKAYWHYQCDFSHRWTMFRDEDADERQEDVLCPYGHEAVTLQKCRLGDVVQVGIRPAMQIVHHTTGRIGHEYEFYLVVTDLHNDREHMSRRTYWWDDVKEHLDTFRNVSFEQACEQLDRLDMLEKK